MALCFQMERGWAPIFQVGAAVEEAEQALASLVQSSGTSKPRACGEEKMEPPASSPCDPKLGRPVGWVMGRGSVSSSGCSQGCLANGAVLLPAQLGLRLGS